MLRIEMWYLRLKNVTTDNFVILTSTRNQKTLVNEILPYTCCSLKRPDTGWVTGGQKWGSCSLYVSNSWRRTTSVMVGSDELQETKFVCVCLWKLCMNL
jgi:hypothetical protein